MFISTFEDYQFYTNRVTYWDNVYGFRMSCMKKWCENEPLVDSINSRSINSSPAAILDINLKTVKVEELNFVSCFSLKMYRDDLITGMVVWFDCFFTDCHMQEKLSTSPWSKTTHWKQTLFYLDDSVSLRKNQKVSGHIAIRKNTVNPRELDIKLYITNYDENKNENVEQTKFFTMH